MPKLAGLPPKRDKITLALQPPTATRLQRLTDLTESGSPGETIRKALKFFETVADAQNEGYELCLRDMATGKLTTVKFIT